MHQDMMNVPGVTMQINSMDPNQIPPFKFGNMQLFLGMRIEALDANNCWNQGKIIGINESNHKVLVHFDGVNQSADKWFDIFDTSIRQPQEEARQVRVGPQPVAITPSNMQRFGPVLSPIPISMASDPSFIYGNIIAGKQNWLNDIAQRRARRKKCFVGLTFTVEGMLSLMNQDEVANIIRRNGGKFKTYLKRKIKYVIVGLNPRKSKMKKVITLGIPTISEQDFVNVIQTLPNAGEQQMRHAVDRYLPDVDRKQNPPTPVRLKQIVSKKTPAAKRGNKRAKRSFSPKRTTEQEPGKIDPVSDSITFKLDLQTLQQYSDVFGGDITSSNTPEKEKNENGNAKNPSLLPMLTEPLGHRAVKRRSLDPYFKPEPSEQSPFVYNISGKANCLGGKVFVYEGESIDLPLPRLIRHFGGTYNRNQTRSAQYLVKGRNPRASKVEMGVERGLKVITVSQLLEMIKTLPAQQFVHHAQKDIVPQPGDGTKAIADDIEGSVTVTKPIANSQAMSLNGIEQSNGTDVATCQSVEEHDYCDRPAMKEVDAAEQTGSEKERDVNREEQQGAVIHQPTSSPSASLDKSTSQALSDANKPLPEPKTPRIIKPFTVEKNSMVGFLVAVDPLMNFIDRRKCVDIIEHCGGKIQKAIDDSTTHFLMNKLNNKRRALEIAANGVMVVGKTALYKIIEEKQMNQKKLQASDISEETKEKSTSSPMAGKREDPMGRSSLSPGRSSQNTDKDQSDSVNSNPASQSLTTEENGNDDKRPRIAKASESTRQKFTGFKQRLSLMGAKNCLSGFSVTVDKSLSLGHRSRCRKLVKQFGGRLLNRFTKTTTHYIVNDLTDVDRIKEARSLGINVLDKKTFLSLIRNLPAKKVKKIPIVLKMEEDTDDQTSNGQSTVWQQQNTLQKAQQGHHLTQQEYAQRNLQQKHHPEQQQRDLHKVQQQPLDTPQARLQRQQEGPQTPQQMQEQHYQSESIHTSTVRPVEYRLERDNITNTGSEDVKIFRRVGPLPAISGRFSTSGGGNGWDPANDERCYWECPENCGNIIEKDQVKSHLEFDCKNAETECPICKFKMLRRELESHISRNVGKHVTILGSEMASLKHINSGLVSENRNLQQNVESLSERVLRLEEQNMLQAEEHKKLQSENSQLAQQVRNMAAMHRS
ncbi:uncharacterized protein LOC135689834 isoform X2 [Rhopilema esculentum]|uniref:uncharacterized protein LOC135689834 isoform X2 n=1 Tax=Rhopilema esculentum TaxID=499914 RepID=UPI0031D9CD66